MQYLSTLDYCIMGIYFAFLVGLGIYLRKKAAASLEDYFLGGKHLPWWALGISGMAMSLDVTGTMVITSFLWMMGPRGLYIAFRGGAVLVLIFMMLWTGKWHRRSNVMTTAEWNIFRFGTRASGHAARLVSAFVALIFTVAMLTYMVKGVGLFLSMYLPFSPATCALLLVIIATLYTMASGFYGVVYTDLFQSGIVLCGVVGVMILATMHLFAHPGELSTLAVQVTGNPDWMNSWPSWHTPMPEGYEGYSYLAVFAFFYLAKSSMMGLSSGGDPKYFGARNERDCSKLSVMWMAMLAFRWPLMMGFAVLGLFLVRDLFPDPAVLAQCADLIRNALGDIPRPQWETVLSSIMNSPEQYPQLVEQLQGVLGDQWADKLKLVSFHGRVNPERIVPAVLMFMIPQGFRGLLMIALLAASMSTFDSQVNMATGFFTRDIYQAYLRPRAANRELIYASYICGVCLVAMGFVLAQSVENINEIWDWIIMGLTSGAIMPAILRLYWWRFNAGGTIIGTIIGLVAALAQRALTTAGLLSWTPIETFLIITAISLVGTIIGTFITRPTDPDVLDRFYLQTRPFGLWGPLKRRLSPDLRWEATLEHTRDLAAVPFVFVAQVTLFLLPMQLLIGAYTSFGWTLGLFAVGAVGVYLIWYRHLPPARDGVPTAEELPPMAPRAE